MMHKNNFYSFGTASRFEIAVRWTGDSEARARLPYRDGWSTGELRITVGGQVLTAHKLNGKVRDQLSWYIAPVAEWLIENWTSILHEESYCWLDKTGLPAAVAAFLAMERSIGADDEAGEAGYAATHAWWTRHALRASDSSALYPDVFFRRVADDMEISWRPRQPAYAPENFALHLVPGCMLLPVEAVAGPLWSFLEWATTPTHLAHESDREMVGILRGQLVRLKRATVLQLARAHVNDSVREHLSRARERTDWQSDARVMDALPAIVALDSSDLMFGGLDGQLGEGDALILMRLLSRKRGGKEAPTLSLLVDSLRAHPRMLPYDEGHVLASDVRGKLRIDAGEMFVDIRRILDGLNIEVVEIALATESIRGGAIAGDGFSSAILVNISSIYNANEAGKRFTLAHELCHILFDRTRARRVSHLSGPWASARMEKRANGFAAMFLASTDALQKSWDIVSAGALHVLAEQVGLGSFTLLEHLFHIDLISDIERESLRQQCH